MKRSLKLCFLEWSFRSVLFVPLLLPSAIDMRILDSTLIVYGFCSRHTNVSDWGYNIRENWEYQSLLISFEFSGNENLNEKKEVVKTSYDRQYVTSKRISRKLYVEKKKYSKNNESSCYCLNWYRRVSWMNRFLNDSVSSLWIAISLTHSRFSFKPPNVIFLITFFNSTLLIQKKKNKYNY